MRRPQNWRPFAPLLAGLGLVLALVGLAPTLQAQVAGRMAAATENPLATRAAIAQMRAGGNAIDAAVTAVLVGGVVSPVSSGVGGGGFAMVWDAKTKQPFLIDFREVAPKGIDVAAYEHRPFPLAQGGRYTGVPGELRGLYELHRRFGKRKWADDVAPAIKLAKNGFAVAPHVAEMLRYFAGKLKHDPNIASEFFPGGNPAAAGRRVKNEKLAATLEKIAAEGPKALYQGPIAADLVKAAHAHHGTLSLADLQAYKPVVRTPIHVKWEGYDVYTMSLPSAGGMMLAQTLEMYPRAYLKKLGFNSGAYQHMLAEAMRASISDRMRFLGDPAFQKVDMNALIAPERMKKRRGRVALDRTHAIPRFDLDEHGTHHLVTADAAGNVVSLTTTVNTVFGAKYTGAKSGVVLNDEMNDFTAQKAVAPFGLKQSPNRPRPGARPISSMTPTIIVKDGRVVLALGGSGGTTIATNVTQMVLSVLAFDHTPKQALAARRFYTPTHGRTMLLEKGVPAKVVKDLRWRGEVVGKMPFTSSAVQMIAIDKSGTKHPAADPRKHGSAMAR